MFHVLLVYREGTENWLREEEDTFGSVGQCGLDLVRQGGGYLLKCRFLLAPDTWALIP